MYRYDKRYKIIVGSATDMREFMLHYIRYIGVKGVTAYLINKNLCCYYWLRQKIGKNRALTLARTTEKAIVMFGRERIKLKPIKHAL